MRRKKIKKVVRNTHHRWVVVEVVLHPAQDPRHLCEAHEPHEPDEAEDAREPHDAVEPPELGRVLVGASDEDVEWDRRDQVDEEVPADVRDRDGLFLATFRRMPTANAEG